MHRDGSCTSRLAKQCDLRIIIGIIAIHLTIMVMIIVMHDDHHEQPPYDHLVAVSFERVDVVFDPLEGHCLFNYTIRAQGLV